MIFSKNFKVVISDDAQKEAKRLTKKYRSFKNDLVALINSLKTDPQQGEALGKDCYKVRFGISSKNKGKSGGGRAITCVKVVGERVIMLAVYDKSDTETISDKELEQRLRNAGL